MRMPRPFQYRPYFELSRQRFTAGDTFDNVFGESSAPFWGAGAQVVFWKDRIYTEAGVSRIAREDSQLVGERVFVSSGTVYQLGIPLRSAIKPWKVAGGYRFHFSPRIIPYAGAGGRRTTTPRNPISQRRKRISIPTAPVPSSRPASRSAPTGGLASSPDSNGRG